MATKVAPPAQQQQGPLGPIQVIPPGLLGLLQLKQLGRLPDKLADTVAGVVELRDWYLTARRVDAYALFGGTPQSSVIASGGVGPGFFRVGGVICQVPNNQIWWVEQYTMSGALAAADTIRIAPYVQGSSAGGGVGPAVGPDYLDTITARGRQFITHIDRGFWAFPGDQFGFDMLDLLSAGGQTVLLYLRATPCPI